VFPPELLFWLLQVFLTQHIVDSVPRLTPNTSVLPGDSVAAGPRPHQLVIRSDPPLCVIYYGSASAASGGAQPRDNSNRLVRNEFDGGVIGQVQGQERGPVQRGFRAERTGDDPQVPGGNHSGLAVNRLAGAGE
jgi:hypothetical protein